MILSMGCLQFGQVDFFSRSNYSVNIGIITYDTFGVNSIFRLFFFLGFSVSGISLEDFVLIPCLEDSLSFSEAGGVVRG